MAMKGKRYTLSDHLTFGKYYGMTIQEVLQKDADYIEWCKNKIDGFVIIDETIGTRNVKSSFYSAGIEVLQYNPWAKQMFENARRLAEDVKLAIEKNPNKNYGIQQLEIAFV